MNTENDGDTGRVLNRVAWFVAQPIWVTAVADISLIYDDWSEYDYTIVSAIEDELQRSAA